MTDTLPQVKLPGYLSMDQTARRMDTTRDYLHRLRQLGVLQPVARLDRTLVYRERDVVDYIISHSALGKVREARRQATTPVPALAQAS
jgi:hypothetical protein